MKYLGQLTIILGVSFLGELCSHFIPLPVPASIYGLVIMLLALCVKLIKVSHVKETSDFLLTAMPIMFIPASAGIIKYWSYIKPMLIPAIIIFLLGTIVVMVVTGRVTQAIIKFGKKGDENVD